MDKKNSINQFSKAPEKSTVIQPLVVVTKTRTKLTNFIITTYIIAGVAAIAGTVINYASIKTADFNWPTIDFKERKAIASLNVQDLTRIICPLMGEGKTSSLDGDVWTGDLGVMFKHQGKGYIMTGDTGGGENFAPNVLGFFTNNILSAYQGVGLSNPGLANDQQSLPCPEINWQTKTNGGPEEYFPLIEPDSTVPAGAIGLDNTIYVFMMDVTSWTEPATARSILVKSKDNGQTFDFIWKWNIDNKFVNISPIVGPDPVDPTKEVVYLVGSGKYRQSPVYLAYVEKKDIEDRTKYKYFKSLQNNIPQWSNNEAEAMPIVDNVKVGELSVQWNYYLKQWLLAFFDYNASNLYFRAAKYPWGPWSEPKLVYSGTEVYDWYGYRVDRFGKQQTWGGAYGGYLLTGLTRQSGRLVYFVLSLWNPYNIFLLETDLAKVFK